eukprot:1314954-Amorphochlora_amoeboformis.AAC.2
MHPGLSTHPETGDFAPGLTRCMSQGSGVQNAKQHEMKQLSVQADRAIRFCLDRYDRWKSLHSEFNDQISDISKATNTTELRRLA